MESLLGHASRLCFLRQDGAPYQPCFEARTKRFAYQFVKEFRGVQIFKDRFPQEGILFVATFSAGGSGNVSLVTIWVFNKQTRRFQNILPHVNISEQGEYLLLSGLGDLLDGVFVSAHAQWRPNETHFAPHYYTIKVYQYAQQSNEYRLVSSYITKRKYPSLDDAERIDVINHEIQNIL